MNKRTWTQFTGGLIALAVALAVGMMGGRAEAAGLSVLKIDFSSLSGSASGFDTITANTFTDLALTDRAGVVTGVKISTRSGAFVGDGNAGAPGTSATYDTILVPIAARNDYKYGTSPNYVKMEITGLQAGTYNVTVFEGRTTDATQAGKLWAGAAGNEPGSDNTGNYGNSGGGFKTITVTLTAGQSLWFAHHDDNVGGTSGLLVRQVPGSAAKLAFTTQPGNGVAGAPLLVQPVVEVQDADGNRVTTDSSTVTLAIGTNPGGGALGGTVSKAAVAGVATFSDLSISAAGNGYTLVATDGTLTSATSAGFNITAAVGPPAKLVYTVVPSSGTAGTAFSVTVQSQDSGGNASAVTSDTTITLSKATGGGTLSGTLTGVIGTGNHTVTIATPVYSKSDTLTLTATPSEGMTGLTPVTSGNIVFSTGAAAKLAFTTQPGGGPASEAWAQPPVVEVQDANGNRATTDSSTVTLAIQDNAGPGGVLSGTTLTQAAVNGVADFSANALSIDIAGNGYTLVATDGTLTSATSSGFNITANPPRARFLGGPYDGWDLDAMAGVASLAPAAKLAFTTQPGNGVAGSQLLVQPVVEVQDADGNRVTTDSSTVTLAIGTNPGGGTLGGTVSKAAVAGVATFTDLSIDVAGNGYTLVATDGALTSATSAGFDITAAAGPPAKLAYTVVPSSGTAGTAFSVTVQSRDAGDIPSAVTSDTTITLSKATGGGTLSGTLTGVIGAGNHTVTIATPVYSKSDTLTLTATPSEGMTGLTPVTSGNIVFSTGAAAKLAFTTQPGGGPAYEAWAQQPAVTLLDANDNTVTGVGQTVTLAIWNNAGPGGVLSGTATVAVNTGTGVATFSGLSIHGVGAGYTLTATGSTVSTTPGVVVSDAFDILANPPLARFLGGSYDGWDLDAMAAYESLELPSQGTIFVFK